MPVRPQSAVMVAAVALFALFAFSGCGASAPVTPAGYDGGSAAPANAFVFYDGGPVLVAPKLYIVFWGYKRYGDPDKVARS